MTTGPPSFLDSTTRLAFGAWGVGGKGWGSPRPESERIAALERAFDSGIRLFDTAPTYGDSESLIGRVFAHRRDRVYIATKTGPHDDPLASLKKSLKRLRTDYVDLLQLHELEQGYEGRIEAMHRLMLEQKVRAMGVCNSTHLELERAGRIAPISTYQGPYNLFDREVEHRVLPFCRDKGIRFLAYRPLAAGLLGEIGVAQAPKFEDGDHRSRVWWFRGREFERRRAVIELLRPIAQRSRVGLPALALGWLLAREDVSFVLMGASSSSHIDQNLKALDHPVPPRVVAEIDAAVARVFRPAKAAEKAKLPSDWGPRERFIVERLDGRRSLESITAEWTDRGEKPLITAQVRVFVDQLADEGLVTFDG